MTLMTASEYIESLRKLKTRVYMFGEKIDNWVDHPIIRPSINCVAMTYALAQDPKYKDLMTATSNLTGHHQPFHPSAPVPGRPHQESQDAATSRSENSQLLPALRRYGLLQRRILHDL